MRTQNLPENFRVVLLAHPAEVTRRLGDDDKWEQLLPQLAEGSQLHLADESGCVGLVIPLPYCLTGEVARQHAQVITREARHPTRQHHAMLVREVQQVLRDVLYILKLQCRLCSTTCSTVEGISRRQIYLLSL